VHPREILIAAADRSAEPEPERQQHRRERAAAGAEDHAGARQHDAQPERGSGGGGVPPAAAELREKIIATRRSLGGPLAAAAAERARSGERAHADTAWPSRRRRATTARPRKPVAPVRNTRIRSSDADAVPHGPTPASPASHWLLCQATNTRRHEGEHTKTRR